MIGGIVAADIGISYKVEVCKVKDRSARTKAEYEEYLNELGTPEADKRSNGGRIPDNSGYGSWMRRNDVIAFSVGYNEWLLEAR